MLVDTTPKHLLPSLPVKFSKPSLLLFKHILRIVYQFFRFISGGDICHIKAGHYLNFQNGLLAPGA